MACIRSEGIREQKRRDVLKDSDINEAERRIIDNVECLEIRLVRAIRMCGTINSD